MVMSSRTETRKDVVALDYVSLRKGKERNREQTETVGPTLVGLTYKHCQLANCSNFVFPSFITVLQPYLPIKLNLDRHVQSLFSECQTLPTPLPEGYEDGNASQIQGDISERHSPNTTQIDEIQENEGLEQSMAADVRQSIETDAIHNKNGPPDAPTDYHLKRLAASLCGENLNDLYQILPANFT